jgi:serine/threonine-protein kinase
MPRIVERYAIYDEIASGGMASVHFARLADPAGAARTVAVKRAHPHLARDKDFALMFLDEARLASRVRHANVVSTIDVLSTPDDLVLVMDYVHGESLWKLMRAVQEQNERIPPPIAAAILAHTLHGLHAAHEATDERGGPLGLVHRDVSPQNVLVGVDGVARLVDFGIAKAAGRLHSTHDSAVKGKYAYMAPEQVRGEPVSRLTDTYAASIVLWELLTGERLFVGKTEAETIHKCLVGRVQAPSLLVPELGRKVDAILKKGLARDPAGRYQTAREMALDLEACIPPAEAREVGAWVERIAGDALAARTATLDQIERSERVAVRSKRGAILAAIALVVVGGVGATAVFTGRGSHREVAAASPEPSAPPSATTLSTGVPAASAPPAAASSTPSVSPPQPAPAPRLPLRSAPSRAVRSKRSGCNPPYSIDSEGRQIFKPECM